MASPSRKTVVRVWPWRLLVAFFGGCIYLIPFNIFCPGGKIMRSTRRWVFTETRSLHYSAPSVSARFKSAIVCNLFAHFRNRDSVIQSEYEDIFKKTNLVSVVISIKFLLIISVHFKWSPTINFVDGTKRLETRGANLYNDVRAPEKYRRILIELPVLIKLC